MESGKISRSRDQTEWMAALPPSIGRIDDTGSCIRVEENEGVDGEMSGAGGNW